jgi:hypothetical protein
LIEAEAVYEKVDPLLEGKGAGLCVSVRAGKVKAPVSVATQKRGDEVFEPRNMAMHALCLENDIVGVV